MSDRELSPALVIGTGLVGASVAHALTRAGITVHLQDKVSSHAHVAASRGAGTTERPDPEQVRLVVVAVPPESLPKVIAKSLATYPHATVTDVGSVKGTVLAALRRTDADLSRYVGSHPMAGSQHVGPLTAHADLFVDRTWVVTPHDTSAAHAVLDVQEVARLCGARRVTMGAAHHDEAVAQVSHLPHLVSVLVAGRLTRVPAEHLRLAGQGLRDVTRIAGSDPALWQQIIGANAVAVRSELVAIQADLAALIGALDAGDLAEVLERGRTGTAALPGKHGISPTSYAHVVVEIPDAPGALARLFRDVEAAGVNVEDLSIDHDLEREVGYLSVQVAPERAAELAEVMSGAGWTVRDREPQL
nr:prephenate dehydrogenase [Propionicimonas sp.]